MNYLKKIAYWLSAGCLLALFEVWSSHAQWVYWIAGITLVQCVGTVLFVLARKANAREVIDFLLPVCNFLISSILFFTLIDQSIIRHIFIVLITIGYLIELHNIYIFFYQSEDYQPYALENINGYINLSAFFLLISSVYGVILYFSWPSWTSILIVFFLACFFSWRAFHSYKVAWSDGKVYIFIIGLVMAEAAMVVNFLPTSFLFNGLLLILMYYLLMNYLRDHLRHMYDRRLLIRYILISASGALIGILTTRWF